MSKTNINPDIRASMMRFDNNKDGKLTSDELKLAAKKFHNSDKELIKDIVNNTVDSKTLTPEDKNNLRNLVTKSHSLEPTIIIFNKANSLEALKEKNNSYLKDHKINLDSLSGEHSKYIGLSEELTTQKYLQVISKFKIHNIQPMSAPTSEIYKYSAGSGSPYSDSILKKLYMSKITEVKQTNGKTLNENFRDKIINSKKDNLDISDVLKISLEVTNGDYALAMATASNTLKSASYDLRGYKNSADGRDSFFTKEFSSDQNDFNKDLKMIEKLGNLRKNNNGDKVGMWYHFFNVQSMSSYYGENKTSLAISAEHFSRDLLPIRKMLQSVVQTNDALSPVDKEKASIDNISLIYLTKY